MTKALVLLSGGMDSSTLAYYVRDILNYSHVHTAGLHYGQTHAEQELNAALDVAHNGGFPYSQYNFSFLPEVIASLLGKEKIPRADMDQQELTVVPARNITFLAYAIQLACSMDIQDIFFGANLDDFKSYPDCRPDFISAMNLAAKAYGTNIVAPFVEMSKIKIVELGLALKVPYEYTYSCYLGKNKPCMVCDACNERAKAFSYFGKDYYGK